MSCEICDARCPGDLCAECRDAEIRAGRAVDEKPAEVKTRAASPEHNGWGNCCASAAPSETCPDHGQWRGECSACPPCEACDDDWERAGQQEPAAVPRRSVGECATWIEMTERLTAEVEKLRAENERLRGWPDVSRLDYLEAENERLEQQRDALQADLVTARQTEGYLNQCIRHVERQRDALADALEKARVLVLAVAEAAPGTPVNAIVGAWSVLDSVTVALRLAGRITSG